jgi:protein TonB
VIRTARWLPLSLALHAAIFCAGLWVARELGERPLFVDLTLRERDDRAGAAGGRGLAAAPEPTKRAAPSPRRTATTASPARASASAASSSAARASAADLTPPPVATSSPVAPATNPSPVVESSPTVEPSRTAEPAPVVQASPAIEPSPARGGAVAGVAPSVSGASADSASVGSGGSDARGAARGGAAATAPAGPGGGDGQLALAVPGAGGAEMYGPYLASLRRRLQEMLEYPPAARRRGLSGTVDLEIALESTGRVSEVLLVRSSSHAMLDEAALHAARNLSRVPFPPDVRPRALRVRLPVVFELR